MPLITREANASKIKCLNYFSETQKVRTKTESQFNTFIRAILILLCIGGFSLQIQAQTAPNGTIEGTNLNTNLKLWLDASDLDGDGIEELFSEDGLTLVGSDQRVDIWKDKATNDGAQDVTIGDNSQKPFLVDDIFNGKPAVDFDTDDRLIHDLASNWSGDYTVFIALQSDASSPNNNDAFFSNASGSGTSGSFQISYNGSADIFQWLGKKAASGSQNYPFGAFESGNLKLFTVRHNHSVDTELELFSDGLTTSAQNFSAQATFSRYAININRVNNLLHDSKIAEVIIYDRALTDCENEEINKYLGLKYGRDFSGFTSTYNHTDFVDNINAIGVKSSTCSANDQRDTASSAELMVDNPSSNTVIDEFLSFANNGNSAIVSINDVPTNIWQRMQKAWRADRTSGFLGTVDLTFDVSQTGLTNSGVYYKLLIDGDDTFATGATQFASNGVYNNGKVTFSGVNLTDGDYFSIAMQSLLANIGTDASNGNNANTASVTAADLNGLTGVSGAIAANEAAYIAAIAANEGTFSSPATETEVQQMITRVNDAESLLADIGTDASNGNNANTASVTAADLNDLTGVSGAIAANEAAYIAAIAANEGTFSSPATETEVQQMITRVNDAESLLADIGTDASNGDNANTASVTAADLNDLTGVSGAIAANEAAYIAAIAANEGTFSSPATETEVQQMITRVNDAESLLADIGTDASNGDNANTASVTAADLNDLTGVSGAIAANEAAYIAAIAANEGTFSSPATETEVQQMITRVNDAESLLADIGTDASNGDNANTASVTAADLNGLTGVSGAIAANEAAYIAAIAANEGTFSSPATETEVQEMITRVNDAESLLADIGTDASNGNNANTASVTAADLNGLTGVSGAIAANEAAYIAAIAANEGTFSSPATETEVQQMITRVNDAESLLADIGTDASNGNNANTASVTAADLNDLTGVSGAIAANEAAYIAAIAANEGTFSSPATETEVQQMITRVNDAESLLADIGTDASNGDNANTASVTAADLNGLTGVSGAIAANEAAYIAAIAANEGTFSSPATETEVQEMITRVNDAESLLADIGTDASNGNNANTSAVTAADLNGLTGVSGAIAANEAAYIAAIAANEGTFSSPATETEVQEMITRVNDAESLLANIGTDASNGNNANTSAVTAADLNGLTGVSGAIAANEAAYIAAIAANEGTFSSPATETEVQQMITRVNDAESLLADIGTDASNGDNANTASVTAADLNGLTGVSGAIAANEAAYIAAIAANEGTFSSPATETEVQEMITRVNDAESLLADIGTDASNGNNTNTSAVTAADLNGLTGVSGAIAANEAAYIAAIAANEGTFSSPATETEVQQMITRVNDAESLLADIGTDASNGDNANTASVTAADLNGLTGVSGAIAANEAAYIAAIAANEGTFSSPATETEVQQMITRVNDAESLLADIGTDASNGDNANTASVTAADLNGLTGVSGAIAANEAAYIAAIAANEGTFSSPATETEVQEMITRVNDAESLLANIGTDASNGNNANTSAVTAADLNGLTGVSGAIAANEAAYIAAIAANEGTFSSPATETEVQEMITRVNDAESLLADIGTDASNGDNANTASVTAADLNGLTGVSGAIAANEAAYIAAIAANEGTFSSPATETEVQEMITRVNDAESLLADIGTDASNGNNANTASVTAADLNGLTGVSGAIAANEAAYIAAIAANEGTFSSPATETEVQEMITRVNDAESLLADIGTDASNGNNANTATVTAADLNGLTGVSGAIAANEAAYIAAIAANEGTFSSPATETEVQEMITRVNDAESLLADIGTDASNGNNTNTASVTAADLNGLTGVSGAIAANEAAYIAAIAANEGTFSSPATETEVQEMITRVNDAESLLADIGTDASNGDNANTATVTAADLNGLTGVSGAIAANEAAYIAAIAANEGTFSSPATETEVQEMITRVNDAESLLADIGTDASNGDNANTASVTAADLNGLTGVSGAIAANEAAYIAAIAANEGTFSSPATETEVQQMITRVNDAESLLADIGTDASNGDNANTASVTAADLNGLTGVSGAIAANEAAYIAAIAANEGTFSSPATETEVQQMITRVNDAESLLADIGTDASNGDDANTSAVTAADLNGLTGVSGAIAANEAAYIAAIAANEGTFSSPATETEVQQMITRVNDAESLLADIGTDASNGNNANTATVTAADLNGLTGVSGAIAANEAAYIAAIAANEGTFSSPATETEVQQMITRVNDAESLLADIGTDASNGDNANTASVTAADLNGLTGVSGAIAANEAAYIAAIAANEGTFSSPATETEVQQMITRVNDAESLLADIGTDASNGDNANTASVTAADLNGLTGVSGAIAANEAAYIAAIAANEGTFSSPATETEVQQMITRVNDAESLLANIGTDASNGNNANTSAVTAADLNGLTGVSGAIAANEAAYIAAIAANEGTFSSPATETEVQQMITRVNDAESLLADIGTDASNGNNTNTATVTAADLNGLTGVSGAIAANEAAYIAAIAANEGTFSSPATETEVQQMITRVNDAESLLADIGTDASNGNNANTATVTAADLNGLTGVSGAIAANEAAYIAAIAANEGTFSSPATETEVQQMITRVNDAESLLADIGTDASNGNNANTASVTAADLNGLTGVSGAIAANEAAYIAAIAANEGTFSSPATETEVQEMITRVNDAESLLADIGTDASNGNNANTATVTAADLNGLTGVSGALQALEENYKESIASNNGPFSSPATEAEVQDMIDRINNSIGVLVQIGSEGDDPDTIPSVVTVAQLEGIVPTITDLDPANEEAYQQYIDENPNLFSTPATIIEVQDMVNTVNTSVSILAQIGEEGDDTDTVPSVVTVSQLESIFPEITGIDPSNEEDYQKYIDENPELFSLPATVQEVQDMVNVVNTSVGVLEQIGEESDDSDTVPSVVTVAQLQSIVPEITDITAAYEEEYQKYIDEHPELFSAPATIAEIQDMVNIVNEENSMLNILLSEILEDSNSVGGEDNVNNSFITASELEEIPGLANIVTENEEAYQKAINSETGFSSLPTIQEIQAIIDTANALMAVINAANDPADGNPSIGDLTTIGVTGLDPENESRYEEAIAKADPKPTSLAELQAIIDQVNSTPTTIIVAEAVTPNGDGINDAWVIQGIENYPNNQVRVYNRSGHEVFAADGYQNNWGASYKDFNNKLPAASYYYSINLGDGSTPIDGWIFINY